MAKARAKAKSKARVRPAAKAKARPAKIEPVPKGYHTITPVLTVSNGAQAIEFYKKAFGAQELFRMTGPDGRSIAHSELKIGDSTFMLGDEAPERGCRSPQSLSGTPVSFYLYVPDVDAAWKRAVSAGCTVTMPLSGMFWGDRCGQVSDPYGHRWTVASHVEDVSPEEVELRAAKAMAQKAAEPVAT
jgi:uncharacterized glyoxalase superfamily protein PhnB